MEIRAAVDDDAPALQEIERRAGERFREVGLDDVADDEPFSHEELAEFASSGRSWVAIDDHGEAIGYVLAMVVDGDAHIEQVSVHPDRQGTGVGRALIEHVAAWANADGRAAITLTTFRDVAWNAPLYAHLGFAVLGDDEVGPELRALFAVEAADGLDPALRVCMRRALR